MSSLLQQQAAPEVEIETFRNSYDNAITLL